MGRRSIFTPIAACGWQRFEERGDGGFTVVRWARGGKDSAPGIDFVVDETGPLASSLEVDEGVTLAEVAAILTIEARRGLSS